jgi:AP-3 complex subunit mu
VMELPVFHPCVRLARWREKPGELSFVPPDGRFVLAGYEVDLLPFQNGKAGDTNSSSLKLPVHVEVKTSLGPQGSDFEVRLFIRKVSGQGNSSISGSSSRSSSHTGGRGASSFVGGFGGQAGTSSTPALEDLVVTIPLPADVRNLSEIRASRGDTTYNPGEKNLDWHIPAKEAVAGGATLRCTIVGPLSDDEDFEGNGFRLDGNYDYDEDAYQSAPAKAAKVADATDEQKDLRKIAQNKILMPNSATVSFSVKGWLASGIKVDSLIIDVRKSRGLGEGVKPYKGVKSIARNLSLHHLITLACFIITPLYFHFFPLVPTHQFPLVEPCPQDTSYSCCLFPYSTYSLVLQE